MGMPHCQNNRDTFRHGKYQTRFDPLVLRQAESRQWNCRHAPVLVDRPDTQGSLSLRRSFGNLRVHPVLFPKFSRTVRHRAETRAVSLKHFEAPDKTHRHDRHEGFVPPAPSYKDQIFLYFEAPYRRQQSFPARQW